MFPAQYTIQSRFKLTVAGEYCKKLCLDSNPEPGEVAIIYAPRREIKSTRQEMLYSSVPVYGADGVELVKIKEVMASSRRIGGGARRYNTAPT